MQRKNYWMVAGTAALLIVMSGCTKETPVVKNGRFTTKGPTDYQASGMMRCSADTALYDNTCSYRVVQGDGTAEIWISDVAKNKYSRYRVFYFDGENFRSESGEPVTSEKTGTGRYKVNVGNEYYLISYRCLTERYEKY